MWHCTARNPCKTFWSEQVLTRSPLLVSTTLTSSSTLFPRPIISYTKYCILSATVCFYFPQRQLPLAGWVTAVCACIIISFTEPVCCRSLWQTSVTQYTVYRNDSQFHRVLHFCCFRCAMLNMNHWDVGELAVLAVWDKRHVKSGTLGLIIN